MTGIKTDSRKEVDKQAINFSMFSSPELFFMSQWKKKYCLFKSESERGRSNRKFD